MSPLGNGSTQVLMTKPSESCCSPDSLTLDAWAADHESRRLAEMYGPSILSDKEMMQRLAQHQIISKTTLLARYNISLEEEQRRVRDAERTG